MQKRDLPRNVMYSAIRISVFVHDPPIIKLGYELIPERFEYCCDLNNLIFCHRQRSINKILAFALILCTRNSLPQIKDCKHRQSVVITQLVLNYVTRYPQNYSTIF